MPDLKNFGKIIDKFQGQNEVYHYTWLIKNFQNIYNNVGSTLESPVFSIGIEYNWKLNIYVADCNGKNREFIGVGIHLEKKSTQHNPEFIVEFSIATESDGKKNKISAAIVTNNSSKIYKVILDKFITKREFLSKPELLPNGELWIHCRIIFDNSNDDKDASVVHNFQENQLKAFEKFFYNAKFSDFTLVVQGIEFKVHRLILAALSPVFDAMFDSKMRESKERKVSIDDVEPHVMEQLLSFVYVGKANALEGLADKVLIAADKYDLKDLKLLCEDTLGRKLSVENVYERLQLANKYNADSLKKKAMEFLEVNGLEGLADKILRDGDIHNLKDLKLLCEDILGRKLSVGNVYNRLQLADKYNADRLKKKAMEFFNENMKELSVQANFEASVGSLPVALQTQIICAFAKKR